LNPGRFRLRATRLTEQHGSDGDLTVHRRTKRLVSIALVAVLALLLAFLAVKWVHARWQEEHSQQQQFTSQDWLHTSSNRHLMAEDLVTSKLLVGKSRAEVLSLLGKPSLSGTLSKVYPSGTPDQIREDLGIAEDDPLPSWIDDYDIGYSGLFGGEIGSVTVLYDSDARVTLVTYWLEEPSD
jgi:hypothetical protein